MARGFYSADGGAAELLNKLVPEEIIETGPYAYVGDSRRENKVEANAEPVEFKGIKIQDCVVGCNKTHITPIETLDAVGEEAQLTPPEMVFGHNQLLFYHEPSGVCYNFLAVEALKGAHFSSQDRKDQDVVSQQQRQLKVSIAKENSNKEAVKELDIPYDWTYTTDYRGNIQRVTRDSTAPNGFTQSDNVRIEATEERIDLEKLKEREPILWFEDVGLYEDELHDHGLSIMSVKVRVMPSGVYILARYWMRLDNVVVRLHETRIHHLFGRNYLLREFSRKEATFDELFAQGHPKGMANYTNIDTFQHLLPVQETCYERVVLE